MLKVFVRTDPYIFALLTLMKEKTMNEARNTVTKEHIAGQITDVVYYVLPGTTVTICSITMKNGFSVRGESACVDPDNFNEKTGREIAYANAFDKLWELEGYLLSNERYLKRRGDENQHETEQNVLRYRLLTDICKVLEVKYFEDIVPKLKGMLSMDRGGLTFGAALAAMKNGDKVARKGWNGQGQYVCIIHPGNAAHHGCPMQKCFGLKNAQGNMQPGWVPSTGDCLATDWYIV